MCLLIESLKVENKTLLNVWYHNSRMNISRHQLFGTNDNIDLREFIDLRHLDPEIIYKCRVIYNASIVSITYQQYIPRKISNFKLVHADALNYSYKFADRNLLDALKDQYPEADAVIYVKDNRITDCNFANLVFFDGLAWYTPETVLLKGTKRQKYLDEGKIIACDICVGDLPAYTNVRIINAMIDLEASPDIPVHCISL